METENPAQKIQEFVAHDGVKLAVRFREATGAYRGTVLWIHGGCEHGGRYDHVLTLFNDAGWSVLLPDHRGHGLSGGVRTDVDSCSTYLKDLVDLQQHYCPTGRAEVVLGHSFGGLLAIRLAQSTSQPRALVLSAPLLGLLLPVPRWKRVIGRLLTFVAPQTRFRTRIQPGNMTRDPEFLAKRLADPLLQRSVTARWFFAMQDALAAAYRDARELTCPLLALQGGQDRTVDPAALPAFLGLTSVSDRTLLAYPQHVHEVLQDSDWRKIAGEILDWLNERVPPPAH